MNYCEIGGILLILLGTLYIFLKAMGKLSSKELGEIESKVFTLKGGPGLLLVGLGVLLLIIGTVSDTPETKTPFEGLTNVETPNYLIGKWSTNDKNIIFMFDSDGSFQLKKLGESVSFTGKYKLTDSKLLLTYDDGSQEVYSLNQIEENTITLDDIVFGRTFTEDTIIEHTSTETTSNLITYDYLIGEWIKSDNSFALTFDSDESLSIQNLDESVSFTGIYELSDSKLFVYYDGYKEIYSLTYIDDYTFKLNDAVYVRSFSETTENLITYDYLIGEWIKSDNSFAFTFYSDGSLLLENLYEFVSFTGIYELSDSKLFVYYDDGDQEIYSLTYIDDYTFKLNDAVYKRI